MNRLTAIGLASLVAYGLLLTTKYMGVVSAARDDKGAVSALNEGQVVGSAVVGAPPQGPSAPKGSLSPPLPPPEAMRVSATAVGFRSSPDLKAVVYGLNS